jgi:hypothetical protein
MRKYNNDNRLSEIIVCLQINKGKGALIVEGVGAGSINILCAITNFKNSKKGAKKIRNGNLIKR